MSTPVRIAEMSWRQVESAVARGAAALVPMGSTEEHGPHAPMGDYVLTDSIVAEVARQTGDIVTPVIPFSYSEYFRHYPGTITLQPQTMHLLVYDTVTCLLDHGISHVILMNGHKGNEPILQPLIRQIRRERGVLVPIAAPLGMGLPTTLKTELYGDNPTGHGGEPGGSMSLHLNPHTVDLARTEEWGLRDFLGLPPDGLNGVFFDGQSIGMAINMEDITPPSGSMSDPRLASADKGARIVETSVNRLVAFVNWFKAVDPRVSR